MSSPHSWVPSFCNPQRLQPSQVLLQLLLPRRNISPSLLYHTPNLLHRPVNIVIPIRPSPIRCLLKPRPNPAPNNTLRRRIEILRRHRSPITIIPLRRRRSVRDRSGILRGCNSSRRRYSGEPDGEASRAGTPKRLFQYPTHLPSPSSVTRRLQLLRHTQTYPSHLLPV